MKMADRLTHNADCFAILGEEFDHVNGWLDACAAKYPPPLFLEYHRKFRHHDRGVKEVRQKWGIKAEEAAKIHIIRDVEIYVNRQGKPFLEYLTYDKLDKIYKQALKYCHDWQGPLDERWLKAP
jgi:hypothetical protein